MARAPFRGSRKDRSYLSARRVYPYRLREADWQVIWMKWLLRRGYLQGYSLSDDNLKKHFPAGKQGSAIRSQLEVLSDGSRWD
jgi:hypothetical protein